MKFLVPNCSCLQNPWLGSYRPQIPVLPVLCPQLNLLNPPPPEQNSWVRQCSYVTHRWQVAGILRQDPSSFRHTIQNYVLLICRFSFPFFFYFIFRSFLFCCSWKLQCVTNMNAIWEPQNSKNCLLSNYVFLQITLTSCRTKNTVQSVFR